MDKSCTNIYKMARKITPYTIEKASGILNISDSSLKNYERGITVPNDDVVLAMIKLYESSWLAYEHLRTSNEIGKMFLPELDIFDLARNVLKFQKEVNDVEVLKNQMIEIACDGKIDNTEKIAWDKITKELKDVLGVLMVLVFFAN